MCERGMRLEWEFLRKRLIGQAVEFGHHSLLVGNHHILGRSNNMDEDRLERGELENSIPLHPDKK